MGNCCSCKQVQLQPGKVHIKKIKEIFHAYLKNQGIKVSKKSDGKDIIDNLIVEKIERHAKTQAKDLIQLMQIDQKFITKVCIVLTEKITDFDQSAEMQYLGLALLKEIMQTPLNENEKQKQQNVLKKELLKFAQQVNKFKKIKSKFATKQNDVDAQNENDNNQKVLSAQVLIQQTAQGFKSATGTGKAKKLRNNLKKQSQISSAVTSQPIQDSQDDKNFINKIQLVSQNKIIDNQYNLQDLQQKEFIFCVQNEQKILQAINEVVLFYQYDLNPANIGTQSINTSPRKSGTVLQKEANTNSQFFAQICLEILNTLIDNIQKTQLIENEEVYFDLLGNFILKNKMGGIYGLFDLHPQYPYAQGLEPVEIQKESEIIQRNFIDYNYLHNNSHQNLVQNSKENKNIIEIFQNKVFSNQILLQAYGGMFKIIKIMKETSFANSFSQIIEYIWCLVKLSKKRIEELGKQNQKRNNNQKQQNEEQKIGDNDLIINDEYSQQLFQLGFDMFQYICVKISNDSMLDQIDKLNLLINGIFQYFNKKQQWKNYKFSEFIFILMIFNGGKTRIDGNIDFADFYMFLQNYYDMKIKNISSQGNRIHFQGMISTIYNQSPISVTDQRSTNSQSPIFDEIMLDKIIENMFRLLMDGLYVSVKNENIDKNHNEQVFSVICFQADKEFLMKKTNMMKVLFEMLNFVESKTDIINSEIYGNNYASMNENITYTKLITESSLYFKIFSDLLNFISNQTIDSLKDEKLQFLQQITQLFELYISKVYKNYSLLVQAIDFFMSRYQVLNYELLKKLKQTIGISSLEQEQQKLNEQILKLQFHIKNLMIYQEAILYFIQETVKQNCSLIDSQDAKYRFSLEWLFKFDGDKSNKNQESLSILIPKNNISPVMRKRLALRNQKLTGSYLGFQSEYKSMLNITKLKRDYQIYLTQTLLIICSDEALELKQQSQQDIFTQSLQEDIIMNALNIDLKLKNINSTIKVLNKYQKNKSQIQNNEQQFDHLFQWPLSDLQKNLYFHEQNIKLQRQDSKSIDIPIAQLNNQEKNFLHLISQKEQLKYKDFLKVYILQINNFLFDSILKISCQKNFIKDEHYQLQNSCLILVLESWLSLIHDAPKNRPELSSLLFISFLVQFVNEIDQFPIEAKLKVYKGSDKLLRSKQNTLIQDGKQARIILEFQIKLKTLFVFMLYGMIIELTNKHQQQVNDEGNSNTIFEFLRLRQFIIQNQRKIETIISINLQQQINKLIPQLPIFDDIQDKIGIIKGKINEKIKQTNSQEDAFESVIANLTDKKSSETIDQISQKFERLLNLDIFQLDKLLSSEIYMSISKEINKVKELAQQDLQTKLNGFYKPNTKYQQNYNQISIDLTIKEIFENQNKNKQGQGLLNNIQVLGFDLMKNVEGNIYTNYLIEETNQHIDKVLDDKKIYQIKQKIFAVVDLNKKFNVKEFYNRSSSNLKRKSGVSQEDIEQLANSTLNSNWNPPEVKHTDIDISITNQKQEQLSHEEVFQIANSDQDNGTFRNQENIQEFVSGGKIQTESLRIKKENQEFFNLESFSSLGSEIGDISHKKQFEKTQYINQKMNQQIVSQKNIYPYNKDRNSQIEEISYQQYF